jgi:hypothetical protein
MNPLPTLSQEHFAAHTAQEKVQRAILLAADLSCAAMFVIICRRMTSVWPGSDLERLAAFQADRPFQYRILLPVLARGLHIVLPQLSIIHAYDVLAVAFMFALLITFRMYLTLHLPSPFAQLSSFGILYPMLWNNAISGIYFYPADIPSVFFFVAGLICLSKQKWRLFHLIFLCAAVNRETGIFLALAFSLIAPGKLPKRRWLPMAIGQCALWLGVKYGLTTLFQYNPGNTVEIHFQANVNMILSLLHGKIGGLKRLFILFGNIWILIPLGWRYQPPLFRRLLWIIPPFVLGMAIVGILREARVYNELVPVLTAPALASIYHIFGKAASARIAASDDSNRSGVAVEGPS